MINGLISGGASNMLHFGNLMARCRREARRIIAGGGPNMRYRLSLVGERLMCAFDEIDACTTLEQRLMLIGANPADARDIEPGRDSMLHLLWGYSLEWSAMRRGDERNTFDCAPLYWAVSFVMLDWIATDEAKPGVDAAMRGAFGGTFEEWATRGNT
ncbi:hypothetical protein [Burkholderia ubonensis]|uniref:hypothetical protein n=1 Tax=Burkholderia ubonensis TaxID=101571 RepID=UPI000F580383|nr:hypothetical protein [Burkholderia ubonensis]